MSRSSDVFYVPQIGIAHDVHDVQSALSREYPHRLCAGIQLDVSHSMTIGDMLQTRAAHTLMRADSFASVSELHVEPGSYQFVGLLPSSPGMTWLQQIKAVTVLGEGWKPAPLAFLTLGSLVHLAITGFDLSQHCTTIRCPEICRSNKWRWGLQRSQGRLQAEKCRRGGYASALHGIAAYKRIA